MRALLSTDDKTGLVELAKGLVTRGCEIVASGRTQQAIADAGLRCRSVADITGSPEMLGGRVKTLHPLIHGGILARPGRVEDDRDIAAYHLPLFDIVVVNLYPFLDLLRQSGTPDDQLIEAIDIGGVALLRAAAKNFEHVLVLSDPSQYHDALTALDEPGGASLQHRRRLAAAAFRLTASYDAAIGAWFSRREPEQFPERLALPLIKLQDLRYGENPHQRAAFYRQPGADSSQATLADAEQLNGREMSFNNLLDLQAALEAVCDFTSPTVVIVKHTNPCGLASHAELAEAYRRAHAGDPVSAYGGIIGANRPIDEATAREIRPLNYDAIIAPDYEPEALRILRRKKQGQMVVLRTGVPLTPPQARANDKRYPLSQLDVKRVSGGFLLQTPDAIRDEEITIVPVTKREPTLEELTDLLFAFRACKHVKSNCVVLAKHQAVVGIGAGQQSRVLAARIAVEKAGERAKGAVMATDGYFPFPDGVEAGIAAGVSAVIHPGGSIRDQQSIEVCDRHGVAMVMTDGLRHFRH